MDLDTYIIQLNTTHRLETSLLHREVIEARNQRAPEIIETYRSGLGHWLLIKKPTAYGLMLMASPKDQPDMGISIWFDATRHRLSLAKVSLYFAKIYAKYNPIFLNPNTGRIIKTETKLDSTPKSSITIPTEKEWANSSEETPIHVKLHN